MIGSHFSAVECGERKDRVQKTVGFRFSWECLTWDHVPGYLVSCDDIEDRYRYLLSRDIAGHWAHAAPPRRGDTNMAGHVSLLSGILPNRSRPEQTRDVLTFLNSFHFFLGMQCYGPGI